MSPDLITGSHHLVLHDQYIGWPMIRMKCQATTEGERKRNTSSEKWLPWLNWQQNVAICKQNRRSNHFLAHHMQGEWTKELHVFFSWICIPLIISRAFPTISICTICLTILCLILSAELLNSSWALLSLPFLVLHAPAIISSNEVAIPFSPCVRAKKFFSFWSIRGNCCPRLATQLCMLSLKTI
jgi:hypothetical protein